MTGLKLMITKSQLLLLFLNLILVPTMLLLDVDILLICIIETFVILTIVCFKDINTNIFFFCFLCSFFVFLVSGDLADALFGKKYWLQFSEAANYHAHFCILLSLVFLLIGYFITKKPYALENINCTSLSEANEYKVIGIREISKYAYYVSYIFLLTDTLYKVYYVLINGYVSYYVGYASILGVFSQIGDLCPIALCSFLATFPSKDECKWPFRWFFVYAICGFLVGQRGALVYNLIFIVGYMFYRNKHDSNAEIWIKKRWIISFCIAIPFVIVFFQIYGYIREGIAFEFESFMDTFVDFFVSIGASSKVIKAGFDYRSYLSDFKFYSLGDTLNYFKYSRLFHWFGTIPAAHTAEYALQGHSYGDMISYLYMKSQYLAGHGAGSSFIACLFTDFGYLGVAIGSFLYGVLFKKISALNSNKWLSTTLKLYALLFLFKSPRGSYDCFVGAIVNVTFIITIVLIHQLGTRLKVSSPRIGNRN